MTHFYHCHMAHALASSSNRNTSYTLVRGAQNPEANESLSNKCQTHRRQNRGGGFLGKILKTDPVIKHFEADPKCKDVVTQLTWTTTEALVLRRDVT